MKALSLPLLVLFVGACVVQGPPDNGPVAVGGNVNVLWTFSDGSSCGTLAGEVDHMQVHIPGQTLENGGAYSCLVAGTQGIELDDFAAGSYSISVLAVDVDGNTLYSWSGSFVVNGDVEVDATLVPLGPSPQPGNISLIWSFTDGNTCASLGGVVDHIQVTMPGQTLENGGAYPCELAGTMGVELDGFDPGDYNYVVAAVDATNEAVYSFSSTLTVDGDITVDVPLAPTGGGPSANTATADLYWSFIDPSGGTHSCNDVGVDTVAVTFSGYGTTTFPCIASNGVEGTEFDNLPTGSYTLTVAGLSNGTQTFGLSEGVLIAAGVNTLDLPMTSN